MTCARPLAVVLGLSLAIAGPAAGQVAAGEAAHEPVIRTIGTGEVTLSPDRATLRIGVESHAATAAAASAETVRRLRGVMDTLASLGVPRDSVRTVSVAVGPNYDYSAGRALIDYQAKTIIGVSSRDLDQLGVLVDAALGAGATDIPHTTVESDSADAGRRVALAEALQQARRDAEALAQAAGGRLGRLLEVVTNPGPEVLWGTAFAATQPRGISIAAPSDVTVRVVIQARWEFLGTGSASSQ